MQTKHDHMETTVTKNTMLLQYIIISLTVYIFNSQRSVYSINN